MSNPPSRYFFAMAGFNMIRSVVASAQDPSIFEINSIGTSPRKICRSMASRIIFCISTKGALPASIDSFESIPETCNWARTRRCSGLFTPIYIAVPYMPQPGVNTLLARKLGHHRVCQFQFDLAIKGIDQIILGLEVGKQSS